MPLNPPDRLRLLDAILEVLEGREDAATSAYETRIALSLLRLLRRELDAGEALLAGEQARLRALLGAEGDVAGLNDRLCERIRGRVIQVSDAALLQHLRQTVLAKLAIDNPRYSAYLRATQAPPGGG
jgi:predicted RNA polymerase sigma factor